MYHLFREIYHLYPLNLMILTISRLYHDVITMSSRCLGENAKYIALCVLWKEWGGFGMNGLRGQKLAFTREVVRWVGRVKRWQQEVTRADLYARAGCVANDLQLHPPPSPPLMIPVLKGAWPRCVFWGRMCRCSGIHIDSISWMYSTSTSCHSVAIEFFSCYMKAN